MDSLKVLITGATGGLGRALSIRLAMAGADLLLLDKTTRKLDALSDEIVAMDMQEPGTCPIDLSRLGPEDCQNLCKVLEEEYGGLDILIHCAAVFHGLHPMDQVNTTQWLECMQVNVNAAWLLTVSCLPLLRKSTESRVVFVQDDLQIPESAYWGAYGVSKAALSSLGKILDQELSETGIQVLNINPGPMRTELRARAYLSENPDEIQTPDQAAKAIIDKLLA